MLTSMSSYVVDMAGQLADMTAEAAMPVTSDMLRVGVAAGLQELALGVARRRVN